MNAPVTERMSLAIAELRKRTAGRRHPKAFYLAPDDYAAFTSSKRPTVESWFGNNPQILVTDPAFEGVPVRVSSSTRSRLYDHTGVGRTLLP